MTPEKLKLEKKKHLHKKYVRKRPLCGLKFFKRNSRSRWTLISCHYPWTICWSWFIDVRFHWPKASRYHWKSFIHFDSRGKLRKVGLRFGFGGIYYHAQDADFHMKDEYFYEGLTQ